MPQRHKKIPTKAAYYTPREVGVLLKVKETTVRLWLRRGLLRGIQIGHSWRIPQTALDELSRSRQNTGEADV